MSNREPTQTTDLQALDQFVVKSDDLLELEERIGRFNIFDALGIVNAEIRHSNFLAWLLDPNESHGQGPLFLKAILMDLLHRSPSELRPRSPVEIDGAELRGVDVYREWRNIDILITCKNPAFVIAIENKIKAGKYNPFKQYEDRVKEHFPKAPKMFVLLTVDGSGLDEYEWVPYSYEDIHGVLLRVRKSNASSISDDVLAFLDHYTRLIGSRFMDDPKIDELCQTIYKNHRAAIDLIVERGRPDPVDVSMIGKVLQNDDRFKIIKSGRRGYDFVPRSWQTLPERISFEGAGRPWIKWFVCVEPTVAFAVIEVGPCNDSDLRKHVIDRIIAIEDKYSIRLSRRKITPTYTRLAGKTLAKWAMEDPPESEKVADIFRKLLDTWHKQFVSLADDLRPIIDAWDKKK
jgi:PD-(D/E)XK nuclease superfamily